MESEPPASRIRQDVSQIPARGDARPPRLQYPRRASLRRAGSGKAFSRFRLGTASPSMGSPSNFRLAIRSPSICVVLFSHFQTTGGFRRRSSSYGGQVAPGLPAVASPRRRDPPTKGKRTKEQRITLEPPRTTKTNVAALAVRVGVAAERAARGVRVAVPRAATQHPRRAGAWPLSGLGHKYGDVFFRLKQRAFLPAGMARAWPRRDGGRPW
jgi:hypothetical protein